MTQKDIQSVLQEDRVFPPSAQFRKAAALKAGELQIKRGNDTKVLAIGEGFAEIRADSIAILTDGAVHEKDIDEQKAEEAVKRAEELLRSNTLEGEELEATQASLARSLAQIKVKRRHHS